MKLSATLFKVPGMGTVLHVLTHFLSKMYDIGTTQLRKNYWKPRGTIENVKKQSYKFIKICKYSYLHQCCALDLMQFQC